MFQWFWVTTLLDIFQFDDVTLLVFPYLNGSANFGSLIYC